MKNLILIFFLSVLSVGCKNEDKQNSSITEQITEVDQPKKFTVHFNLKTNKTDVFKIMMNNIEVDELQKKNIVIFEELSSSSKGDVIVAEFDANNMSNHIVFHLGNNSIKEVEIQSILVAYGKNQYNITTAADINKYLVFNKFIERDTMNKTLKTKKVDGILYPTFSIKNNLIKILNREQ